jgi:CRISPR-associated protein Cas2
MSATHFYLVAYDLSSDKRCNKVHRILSGFGQWTQYSLFELFITDKELVLLQSKLEKVLNAEKGSVRFYPLCAACLKGVERVGSEPPREPKIFRLKRRERRSTVKKNGRARQPQPPWVGAAPR